MVFMYKNQSLLLGFDYDACARGPCCVMHYASHLMPGASCQGSFVTPNVMHAVPSAEEERRDAERGQEHQRGLCTIHTQDLLTVGNFFDDAFTYSPCSPRISVRSRSSPHHPALSTPNGQVSIITPPPLLFYRPSLTLSTSRLTRPSPKPPLHNQAVFPPRSFPARPTQHPHPPPLRSNAPAQAP